MSKKIVFTAVAALVCVAFSSARAADQVPAGTLGQMGLSDLQVMSDSESMAVRGKFAIAGGISWAGIGPIFAPPTTGSINFYLGTGAYEAFGQNASSASATTTNTQIVTFMDGTSNSVTNISSISIGAAGFSHAKGF